MTDLVACPFCRQMFSRGETPACPDCGLGLKDLAKLPPSYDAEVEMPEIPTPPHMETLPWTYAGRNRALLLALSILGFGLFFAPWVRESAPEIRTLSGFGLAQLRGYFWAPAVAWFVMVPLVLTRRSVFRMRGSRIAVGFLAATVLLTIVNLLLHPPAPSRLQAVHIEWAWGIFAAGAVALAGMVAAVGFGGSLDDLPTTARRRGDETLH